MRTSKLKFIISILIFSLLIAGCSNPIDEYQKNINNACDSLSYNLEEALLIEDPSEIESLAIDLEFRSLVLSRAGFSDYENVENNPYYLQASNSLKSIVDRFLTSDGLTLSDEFISAMNKFILVDCKKDNSIDTTQTDSNTSEEEIIQSESTTPTQEKTPQVAPTERIITLPKLVGYSMAQVDEWKWQNQIKLIFSYNTAFNYQTLLSCQVQKRGIVLAQSYPPGTQLIDSYLTFVNLDINC
jgi:PBP1b-binding outer membrane lipoprotein LpoB